MNQLVQVSSMKNLTKKNYLPWVVLVLISGILLFWAVFAVQSENKHRELAALYADAFILYTKIDLQKPYNTTIKTEVESVISKMKPVSDFSSDFVEKYLAILQIGILYSYMGDTKTAISYLEKLQSAPKSFISKPQALTLLARLYETDNHKEKAINIYEKLKNEVSENFKDFVYYQLGVLYSTEKITMNKAIQNYEQINEKSTLKTFANRNIFMLKAISQTVTK